MFASKNFSTFAFKKSGGTVEIAFGEKPVVTYSLLIIIYNVGGVLMRTLQPSEDGSTSASLDGLPAGTHIIKNGTTSYKTIKK